MCCHGEERGERGEGGRKRGNTSTNCGEIRDERRLRRGEKVVVFFAVKSTGMRTLVSLTISIIIFLPLEKPTEPVQPKLSNMNKNSLLIPALTRITGRLNKSIIGV